MNIITDMVLAPGELAPVISACRFPVTSVRCRTADHNIKDVVDNYTLLVLHK